MKVTINNRSFLFLLLFVSCLLFHPDDLFLFLNFFTTKEFLPILIQLRFFCFYIQFDSFTSEFFCLFIKQKNSWNILLSSHSFSFNELHISFIIMLLLIFYQLILNCNHIVNIHIRIVFKVQSKLKKDTYNIRVVFYSIISRSMREAFSSNPVPFRFSDNKV